MSTPHINPAIVFAGIVLGLVSCSGASHSAPSSIPTAPASPAPVDARSIFPESGPTWRFTPVEILGAGFQPGLTVTFGLASMSFTICRMTSTPMSREAAS